MQVSRTKINTYEDSFHYSRKHSRPPGPPNLEPQVLIILPGRKISGLRITSTCVWNFFSPCHPDKLREVLRLAEQSLLPLLHRPFPSLSGKFDLWASLIQIQSRFLEFRPFFLLDPTPVYAMLLYNITHIYFSTANFYPRRARWARGERKIYLCHIVQLKRWKITKVSLQEINRNQL